MAFDFLAKKLPKVSKIFEPTKNPSINGAFSILLSQTMEPMASEVQKNLEPKEVLDFPNDFGPIVLKSRGLLKYKDKFRTYDRSKAFPDPDLVIRDLPAGRQVSNS